MIHDEVLSSLRQSAAIKLLQAQNAPLILTFLYGQFKLKQQISIAHTPLSENLTTYLEAFAESHPGAYSGTAVYYLRLWCDGVLLAIRRMG